MLSIEADSKVACWNFLGILPVIMKNGMTGKNHIRGTNNRQYLKGNNFARKIQPREKVGKQTFKYELICNTERSWYLILFKTLRSSTSLS